MFEYDWEVIEILNGGEEDERIGAIVLYTPVAVRTSPVEKFVPVPWRKARDRAHAEEILEGKINAYAPETEWNAELEAPVANNSEEIVSEMNSDPMKTGEVRAPEGAR